MSIADRRRKVTEEFLKFTPKFRNILIFLILEGLFIKGDGIVLHSLDGNLLEGAPPIQYSTLSGPSFNSNISTDSASVVAGSTGILACAIRNLHNYTVSWVRSRDTRLLTTGAITYTSDKRFVASNPKRGSQWMLRIHYARVADSGLYLCQVSTTPPISFPINFTVIQALLRVYPGREAHVQLGSRLELVCEVEGCRGFSLLSWTRDGRSIHDSDITASDDTSPSLSTISRLTLSRPRATAKDSGTYTCSSSCTHQPANVTVHVLKGEELAAMQHLNCATKNLSQTLSLSLSCAIYLLYSLSLERALSPVHLHTLRVLRNPT